MRTPALEPVVRFLNPEGTAWVGTGFIVPRGRGQNGLYAMTCAHVIAAALGDKDAAADPVAPGDPVTVIFRDQTSATYQAEVVPETWRPVPSQVNDPGGAIDIAVVRLIDLEELPDSTRMPAISSKPAPGQKVIAFGPRERGQTKLNRKGRWSRATVSEPNRGDEIEFVTDDVISDNIIYGGFSGGPLTDRDTYEIIGMVRAVQTRQSRRAYAVPVSLLAEVWEPLLEKRVRVRSGIHPIFDLIAREGQAGILSRETRLRIEASRGRPADHAPMTFVVDGSRMEAHGHMNRRALLEIAGHAERDTRGPVNIIKQPLAFPEWGATIADRVDLLKEALLRASNADGTSVEELRVALERSAPDGWLFHLTMTEDASDEDGEVLRAFLKLWDDIAEGATCELYLHVSFALDVTRNESCSAAVLYGALTSEQNSKIVTLPPLRPVRPPEIEFWSQKIFAEGHIEDEGVAIDLMYELQGFLEERPSLEMHHLLERIRREKIDPDNL